MYSQCIAYLDALFLKLAKIEGFYYMPHIAVIGAGVIGLSVAIELLRREYNVTIYAENISPNTTSDVAAAIWAPFRIEPAEQAMQWAIDSLKRFKQITEVVPEAGIIFKTHTELFETAQEKPQWLQCLQPLPQPKYVLDKYKIHSYSVMLPLIDSSQYMPYLNKLFLECGGKMTHTRIDDINTLLNAHNIVVNCTGLGAKQLVNDEQLYPIRGQVLSIEKIPGFDDSLVLSTATELTHLFSRVNDCLIGGTVDEEDWRKSADHDITQSILSRVTAIYPPLGKVKIIRELVGLRPARSSVRLELERIGEKKAVIHNYGHGGAGYTVSWGCAMSVVELVKQALL